MQVARKVPEGGINGGECRSLGVLGRELQTLADQGRPCGTCSVCRRFRPAPSSVKTSTGTNITKITPKCLVRVLRKCGRVVNAHKFVCRRCTSLGRLLRLRIRRQSNPGQMVRARLGVTVCCVSRTDIHVIGTRGCTR